MKETNVSWDSEDGKGVIEKNSQTSIFMGIT